MPGFQKELMGAGLAPLVAATINGVGELGKTATGTNQATGYPLTRPATEFTTVAASTAAVLPTLGLNVLGGDVLAVFNQGASTLSVFPPVGFKIGLAATNAAVSVATGKSALFFARGDGNYFAIVGA